jgi:hypothetical protein
MPPSAHAPVNNVPVACQGERKHQKGNQEQTGSFRRINRVPLMPVGIVMASCVNHDFIVRCPETGLTKYAHSFLVSGSV